MTEVRNDNNTLISSIEEVIPFYRGNGLSLDKQSIGFETEIGVYKNGPDGNPVGASTPDTTALLAYLKSLGHEAQLEMASAVEYASPPFRVTEVPQLVREIKKSWDDYLAAIAAKGFRINDASFFPFATLKSAESNLVDRDRARGLVKGMKLHKAVEFLKVTLLASSTQISLSYKDPADLHDLLTTGYALQAPIFALFANYPPFIEGSDKRIDYNPRAAFYEAFGDQGSIPKTLLEAKDGDDFIRRHAQQVFENPLLYYYDSTGTIIWPEKPLTFRQLKDIGLNTRSNYDLAESFLYSDIKVCNIRDEEGQPVGKRIEIRALDAGKLGVLAGAPFIHAVLRDPQAHLQIKALLAEYGLTPDQSGWQERIIAARHNASYHGGKYLDVPFGLRPDGRPGNLKDFSRELADILQLYVQRNPALKDALQPLIDIAKSGITQAELKSRATNSYAEANHKLVADTAGQKRTGKYNPRVPRSEVHKPRKLG